MDATERQGEKAAMTTSSLPLQSDTSSMDDSTTVGCRNVDSTKTEEKSSHLISSNPHLDQPMLPPHAPTRRLSLVRLLSSCSSIGSESKSHHHQHGHAPPPPPCPLCLDTMTPMDLQHALLCPTRHCHYNFCATCIESLISSSKDDYEMASDGNAHVKVYLNCPNCRADLSPTIRDTLLLRKADTVTWLVSSAAHQTTPSTSSCCTGSEAAADTAAVTLTPSQQRTLAAMQELDVQEAIQQAREVEESFWQRHEYSQTDSSNPTTATATASAASSRRPSLCRWEASIRELSLSPRSTTRTGLMATTFEEGEEPEENRDDADYDDVNDDDNIVVDYEEWGVEADLIAGVHNSIHLPRDQQVVMGTTTSNDPTGTAGNSRQPPKTRRLDPTILQGLEFTMTRVEKLQVTQWMTSGKVHDLARAARLFQQLEHYARQGVSPAKRQQHGDLRRGSVYEIVEETRKVHEQQQDEKKVDHENLASLPTAKHQVVRGAGPPQSRRNHEQQRILAERRQLEKAIQEQTYLLERFPLPVRMPKCVTLGFPNFGNKVNVDTHALLARKFPLVFCNDTWDGTVLDAYSKLTITGRPPNSCTVTRKKTQHAGVYHVLSCGQYTQHYGPVEMTVGQHSHARVLVASVQGEAGRKGVIKGDVVTHVDGEEFHGTVDDLLELLHAKATTMIPSSQQQQSKIEFIFNAEPSVAEAMRRRAMVLE